MQTSPLYPSPVSPYDKEMGVRVYQRKSAEGRESRFFLYYRYDKQTWRVFKDPAGFPFASKNAANAIATQINAEILQKCHNPYKYQAATGKRWLFKNQINIWLEDKRKVNKEATIRNYECFIRLYIMPFFAHLDVSEIKSHHCYDFLKTLPDTVSAQTKQIILDCLKAFLRHCYKIDMLQKMPVMPTVKVPKKAIKWADYEAQNRVLFHIPDAHKPIFHFAMRHGMRIGEVRGLMVKKVDFAKKTITVDQQLNKYQQIDTTKTGTARVIPLHPELVDTVFALCSGKMPDAFVFTVRGRPYAPETVYGLAQKALKAEGLQMTAYQLFRHSVLTQAAVRQINPMLIQQYAGHSSFATTRKYIDNTALNVASVQSMAPVVELMKAKGEKK